MSIFLVQHTLHKYAQRTRLTMSIAPDSGALAGSYVNSELQASV